MEDQKSYSKSKLSAGIEEIKKIRMTSDEKKHVLENILKFSVSEERPMKRTYQFCSFLSTLSRNIKKIKW